MANISYFWFDDYKMNYRHSPYPDKFDKWWSEHMSRQGYMYTRRVTCKSFNWYSGESHMGTELVWNTHWIFLCGAPYGAHTVEPVRCRVGTKTRPLEACGLFGKNMCAALWSHMAPGSLIWPIGQHLHEIILVSSLGLRGRKSYHKGSVECDWDITYKE